MADQLSRGTLFDPILVSDLITKVKGKSSLAVLSQQEPVPFNGMKEFVFTMDSDIDVVAENGKKSHGGISLEPVIIRPIKVEYGARISDEFIFAADETKVDILRSFNDGFAKKVARGIDLMAFHGMNPRTKVKSDVIGTNNFDNKVTQSVTYTEADPEANIQSAVELIQGSEHEISGMAFAPTFSSAMAKIKVNGVKQFPELAWGGNPGSINGLKLDVNSTVSAGDARTEAYIGDFASMFKWGYAREIPLEIIKYGDPDNTGKDLKGYNQVYIRAEAYIGWGIMDPNAFAVIKGA